jgi:hypothetical protein
MDFQFFLDRSVPITNPIFLVYTEKAERKAENCHGTPKLQQLCDFKRTTELS